jgi:hypothetical protein
MFDASFVLCSVFPLYFQILFMEKWKKFYEVKQKIFVRYKKGKTFQIFKFSIQKGKLKEKLN